MDAEGEYATRYQRASIVQKESREIAHPLSRMWPCAIAWPSRATVAASAVGNVGVQGDGKQQREQSAKPEDRTDREADPPRAIRPSLRSRRALRRPVGIAGSARA